MAKVTACIAVVVALAYSVWLQWTAVHQALAHLTLVSSVSAIGLSLGSMGAAVLAWRKVMGGLGTVMSVSTAVSMYSTSQLAKYVPGGIWTLVAQVQVGRVFHVPGRRSAAAFFLTLGASLTVAVALGGLLALTSEGVGTLYAVLPLCLLGMHPTVFRYARRLSARAQEHGHEQEHLADSPGGTLQVLCWLLLHWLLLGAATIVLVGGVGAHAPASRVVGAVALSWAVGLVIILVPAGAGVREGFLTALLAPYVGVGTALTVALLSRLALTAADVILALIGLAIWRRTLARENHLHRAANAAG